MKTPAAKVAAAQPRKAVAKKGSNDAGVSTSQPVNAADVAAYWTLDRIKNAEPAPMGARQGGAAAKPAPTGKAAGGATGGQAKSQKKASRAQAPADLSVSSSQQVNPADIAAYWTPERMKSAQPAGMGVPGGSSGSPPASGDSAGGTAPSAQPGEPPSPRRPFAVGEMSAVGRSTSLSSSAAVIARARAVVRRILDAHPRIHCGPEVHVLP